MSGSNGLESLVHDHLHVLKHEIGPPDYRVTTHEKVTAWLNNCVASPPELYPDNSHSSVETSDDVVNLLSDEENAASQQQGDVVDSEQDNNEGRNNQVTDEITANSPTMKINNTNKTETSLMLMKIQTTSNKKYPKTYRLLI